MSTHCVGEAGTCAVAGAATTKSGGEMGEGAAHCFRGNDEEFLRWRGNGGWERMVERRISPKSKQCQRCSTVRVVADGGGKSVRWLGSTLKAPDHELVLSGMGAKSRGAKSDFIDLKRLYINYTR